MTKLINLFIMKMTVEHPQSLQGLVNKDENRLGSKSDQDYELYGLVQFRPVHAVVFTPRRPLPPLVVFLPELPVPVHGLPDCPHVLASLADCDGWEVKLCDGLCHCLQASDGAVVPPVSEDSS